MNQLYWLEQTEADVPAGNDWLSAGEAAVLDTLRFPKRRRDWRLGRWTAKRAFSIYSREPRNLTELADIEVRATSSGAPELRLHGEPATVAISLSHRAGTAMCAISPARMAVGCDLEVIEERSANFLADYFAKEEQELIIGARRSAQPLLGTLLWSAKESALKVLGVGLRQDTRSVIVSPWLSPVSDRRSWDGNLIKVIFHSDQWYPLHARSCDGDLFRGWWQYAGALLRTVAIPWQRT